MVKTISDILISTNFWDDSLKKTSAKILSKVLLTSGSSKKSEQNTNAIKNYVYSWFGFCFDYLIEPHLSKA